MLHRCTLFGRRGEARVLASFITFIDNILGSTITNVNLVLTLAVKMFLSSGTLKSAHVLTPQLRSWCGLQIQSRFLSTIC
jgi:hypothetical protein